MQELVLVRGVAQQVTNAKPAGSARCHRLLTKNHDPSARSEP